MRDDKGKIQVKDAILYREPWAGCSSPLLKPLIS